MEEEACFEGFAMPISIEEKFTGRDVSCPGAASYKEWALCTRDIPRDRNRRADRLFFAERSPAPRGAFRSRT
jgi:hypothetical protein